MTEPLAIDVLIGDRCAQLGMSPIALVRRTGSKNTSKAMRRLEQLRRGDIAKTADLIRALPAALGLPEEAITGAVEQTRLQLAEIERARAEKAEADWRAAFLPHAIILTERSTPQPVFVALVTRAGPKRRIDLDLSVPRSSFIQQALNELPNRLVDISCFGAPTGIIINFDLKRAVRYNLDGIAQEIYPEAVVLGEGSLYLKSGKKIPDGMFTP